jgi:hypothetical protein
MFGDATAEMAAAALAKKWLRLDGAATALAGGQALWLYVLMAAAGQAPAEDGLAERAQEAFWPLDGTPPAPGAPAFGIASFDAAQWREALNALAAPQK